MKKVIYVFLFALTTICASAANKESYYFQRAEEAYDNEDFDECLQFCEEGVKNNPKDGKCWAVMAEIYSKSAYARYSDALEVADIALGLLKKDKTWTAFLYAIKGDTYFKIGDYASSRQAYASAIHLSPTDIRYLISYADVCKEMKDWQKCADTYKCVLEQNPGKIFVYGELAEAEYNLRKLDDAKKHCRMAEVLSDGENIKYHLVIAQMAMDEHNLPLAAKEFARAIFLEKEYEELADTLVDMYPEVMTAAILNEVDKAPSDIETNNIAAQYFYILQDYVRSLYHLHKAYEVQESPALEIQMAYAYKRLDKLAEAEHWLKKCIDRDSIGDEENYYMLGGTYLDDGNYSEAEKCFRKAINLSPSSAENYRLYARSIILTDPERALNYMDTTVMLAQNTEIMNALFNRAEVLRMLGRDEEALRDLNAATAYKGSDAYDAVDMLYVNALLGNKVEVDNYIDSARQKPRTIHRYMSYAGAYACMHNKQKVMEIAEEYFRKGGREVSEFRNNFRMRFLADDKDYVALLDHYDSIRRRELEDLENIISGTDTIAGLTEIPFTRQNGVCQVKCAVNGLPLYFVFDTGASDVTLSNVEANFMLKNGYLSEADFMGKQNYMTADGNIHEGTLINLREVRIGDIVLRNIKASVVNSQSAPLLLGQTVFRRFGRVELDNKRSVICFINESGQ